jgi:hypothetical protein
MPDLGDDSEPFVWDEKRRALLRAELDAFFFRLYGIEDQDDVDYILETFPVLKHNEIRDYHTYRTTALATQPRRPAELVPVAGDFGASCSIIELLLPIVNLTLPT